MSQYDSNQHEQHELLSMVNQAAAGTLSRRGFVALAGAIGAGQLLSTQLGPLRRAFGAGPSMPAVPGGASGAGNLVVVYLGGGNDGLNTLVPVTDQAYHDARSTIKLMPTEVLSLGADVPLGLHPSLLNLQRRYLAGQVALITGVGYNAPDLSHFNSLDHWEAGYGALGSPLVPTQSGWLGRWLDGVGAGPFGAVSFRADDKSVLGASTDPIRLRPWDGDLLGGPGRNDMEPFAVAALRNMTGRTGLGAYADALGSVLGSAITAGGLVGPAMKGIPDGTSYIGRQMVISGRLLNAGIGTRVITAVHGGFDTHNEQAIRGTNGNPFGWHGKLLKDLDVALELLFSTMTASVRANTTVLVYSEFGRRVEENGSFGTDHGQAGVSMVLGEGVNGGIFGEQPSLTDLQDGNIKMNVDFRSIYATILSRFLGANDVNIIGAAHQRLLLSKADAQAGTSTTTTSTSTSTSTTSSTVVATTVASTTQAPTTVAPTTVASTTSVSTTGVETTAAPTTAAITTAASTTAASTTAASTTAAPTTAAPTTMLAPTTAAPTTRATTVAPSSTTSSTLKPSTTIPNFKPPVDVTPSPGPGLPADPDPTPAPLPQAPPPSRNDPIPSGVFDPPVAEVPVPSTVASTTAPASDPVVAPTPSSVAPSSTGRPTTTLPKRLALKPKPKPKATTPPKKKVAKKVVPKKALKKPTPSSVARVVTKKR
jgi:uncharacterized protein (DUF1501 family)